MPTDVPARIRSLREARGWSQEDLAAKMQLRGHGITQRRQSDIETGRRRVLWDEVVSYARIFGIPITAFLEEPDENS